MKKIQYTGLILGMVFCLLACNDYLDINVDPNTPSSTSASIKSRLPWIQHHYLYAQQCAAFRSTFITQQLTTTSRVTRDGYSAQWQGIASISTTPYQWFFVVASANFNDLYKKAEAEGAYHYMGAVKTIKAAGFMLMTDWYGEMPYTEALGATVTPKYDDGKTIFMGCLNDIDEAIRLFEKVQEKGATPLSDGDSWNNGDVNKWIRMCYGLKARWLNNLSKKPTLYKPDAILECISKGPQSNDESTIIKHVDSSGDNVGDVMWADPLMTSILFNNCGMNTNSRFTKWYTDLLENFDGKGIEDPRANKLIPHAQVGTDKHFMRSTGVDMQSRIRLEGGPFPTSYNATGEVIQKYGQTIKPGAWYCATDNKARWGDTIYVSTRSGAIGYFKTEDDQYRADDGTIMATGTFYSRPDGPTHFLCFHEMCFIKAEVLFKKGDKAGAFSAYKEGVKAHIELMNQKLKEYNDTRNPSKTIMTQEAIDYFLIHAIGTADDLTLGKIMTQKVIALSFMQQTWNDMRRHDYSTTSYPNWKIPAEYSENSNAQTTIPQGKQYRRIRQPAIESTYNSENLKNSHESALKDDIWSYNVWWDTPDE